MDKYGKFQRYAIGESVRSINFGQVQGAWCTAAVPDRMRRTPEIRHKHSAYYLGWPRVNQAPIFHIGIQVNPSLIERVGGWYNRQSHYTADVWLCVCDI